MPARPGFDERLAEHRHRYDARLAATRRVTASPEGRDRLRALRVVSQPPPTVRPGRHPLLVLALVLVAEVVLLVLAARAL